MFRTEVSEGLEREGAGVVRAGPDLGVGLTDAIPTGGCALLGS